MWAWDAPSRESHDLHPDPAKPGTQRILADKVAGGYVADDVTASILDVARCRCSGTRMACGTRSAIIPTWPSSTSSTTSSTCTESPRITVEWSTAPTCIAMSGWLRGARPGGRPYFGLTGLLDGGVSCSAVVDPDTVTGEFKECPRFFQNSSSLPRRNSGR